MAAKRQIEDEVKAFLGKGTEFEGKLIFTGSVRIDGKFSGEIVGNGILNIGGGAHIEADIFVDSIMISGDVNGNLEIKKRAEIFSTGVVNGNLKTVALVVHEGARLEGYCHMKSEPMIRAVGKEEMA